MDNYTILYRNILFISSFFAILILSFTPWHRLAGQVSSLPKLPSFAERPLVPSLEVDTARNLQSWWSGQSEMGMFSTRNGNVYMICSCKKHVKNTEIPINFRIGWGAYQQTSAMKGNGPMWASLERTKCHGKWHRTAQTWHGEFVGCKGQNVLIWSCLLVGKMN